MSFMIAKCWIDRRVREVFLHQVEEIVHDLQIHLPASGPDIVRDEISRHDDVTNVLTYE